MDLARKPITQQARKHYKSRSPVGERLKNSVRRVGESVKKSEIVCKTTADPCESLHPLQLPLTNCR